MKMFMVATLIDFCFDSDVTCMSEVLNPWSLCVPVFCVIAAESPHRFCDKD